MAQTAIDGELRSEFAAVAQQAGCELVHAEYRGGTLRVFLDRPEGVTLGDCATVSKELSAVLDVADFGKGHYTLEVSSPGLDRQLYTPADYERFCGRLVRVTYLEERPEATDSGAAAMITLQQPSIIALSDRDTRIFGIDEIDVDDILRV